MSAIRQTIQVGLAVISALCIAFAMPCSLTAGEKTGFDAIQVNSVKQSSSITISKETLHPDDDAEIARKLRQQLSRIRARDSEATRESDTKLDKRRMSKLNSKETDMEIRFRHTTGTPMQMKPKNGDVLYRASRERANTREGHQKTAREFLRAVRGVLGIDDPDNELKMYKYQSDDLGRRHLRFSQHYQNLPIYPAELIIHLDKEGNVDLLEGGFVRTPRRIITKPFINTEDAVKKAVDTVPGGKSAAVSKPELIIYAPKNRRPSLAWKMEVMVSPISQWLVVIDAVSGKSLTAYNQVPNVNVQGAGTDLFGNTQQLNVWKENSTYHMIDTTKSMYNGLSPVQNRETSGSVVILDLQNQSANLVDLINSATSTSPTYGWLPDAVSAAHNMSLVYDYFLERHNHNSLDAQGMSIIGIVRLEQNEENAYFSQGSKCVLYGDGMPFAQSLDLVGHEMAHGVTYFSGGLNYQYQSGALNEGFSDIFGEAVEAYVFGSADWYSCTDCGKGRNLADPNTTMIPGTNIPRPAKMSEYLVTDLDNGGVHLNCTIIGHAFYLMTEGLNGSIGFEKAERIAYRALIFHLNSDSQFIDARLAFIASAEELFGNNSPEALTVAEAFDAVEIFDESGTPSTPPSAPPVAGNDASVFITYVYNPYFPLFSGYYLGRCETGSDPECVQISSSKAVLSKPSVSGDGSFAVFVAENKDMCSTFTDGSLSQDICLGLPGVVNSVSMSPDENLWGFVLLDEEGQPTNKITVIDYRKNSEEGELFTYDLVSPTDSDVSFDTILYADAMEFSADGKHLIYDALNVLNISDGSRISAWSIYQIDIETGQTHVIVSPIQGLDIGYPSLSQTSDKFVTFEAVEQDTGDVGVFTANLITGEMNRIALLNGYQAIPSYSGDDSYVIYSKLDANTYTGLSLWGQAVDADRITPVGDSEAFINDAGYGVIYRRGTFVTPEPDISASSPALSFGNVNKGDSSELSSLTISNNGIADLKITDQIVTGTNASEFRVANSSCTGRMLPPTATCNMNLIFSPTSEGTKNALLSIQSDDPDTPALSVQLNGTGVTSSETVATPAMETELCNNNTATCVTLTCATSGAVIHYTINGTEPTENSPIYETPIVISTYAFIKAKAYKNGMNPSALYSGLVSHSTLETVVTPEVSPDPGTYSSALDITISCATAGATIRYTTDGTEPTENSMIYQAPIHISATTTLKARAYKENMNDSSVITKTYVISTCSGDVNRDGTIDLKDAILALQVCAGFIVNVYKECDIDGDSRIGLQEAIHAVRAVSEPAEFHTITATAEEHGYIDPSGEIVADPGAALNFTIGADDGYHVSDVLLDGVFLGVQTSITLENISGDHAVHVKVQKDNGDTIVEQEPNNTSQNAQSAGILNIGDSIHISGHLDSGGIQDNQYSGDFDFYSFVLPVQANVSITLDWSGEADLDFGIIGKGVVLDGDIGLQKPALLSGTFSEETFYLNVVSKDQAADYQFTLSASSSTATYLNHVSILNGEYWREGSGALVYMFRFNGLGAWEYCSWMEPMGERCDYAGFYSVWYPFIVFTYNSGAVDIYRLEFISNNIISINGVLYEK